MSDVTSDPSKATLDQAQEPPMSDASANAFVPAPADDPGLTNTSVNADEQGPTDDSHDQANEAAAEAAVAAQEAAQQHAREILELKIAMLESGELANRAATTSTSAGVDMQQATQKLSEAIDAQQKLTLVIVAITSAVLLMAMAVFALMAFRLQNRVSDLDAIVLAVGKRVVSMDASIEMMGGSAALLKDVASKQDAIMNAQVKLEGRLDESVKSAQAAPEQAAKQMDAKTEDMLKVIKGLDSRLQAQASAVAGLSSGIQRLQGAMPDAASVRRELEAARQQRERQTQQAAPAAQPASASNAAAVAASAAATRQRERMVQYPRAATP